MNLKEIAKLANVSPATVSIVLHQKPGVNSGTREKIRLLLEENGYTLSEPSRKQKKQKNIRFIKYSRHSLLVDGNAFFVSSIVDTIEKESRRLGYNLIMTVVKSEDFKEVTAMLREDRSDGVILLGTEALETDIQELCQLQTPLVIVDNLAVNSSLNCVLANNQQMVFIALQHLVGLGHKKIGFLANACPTCNCTALRKAYKTVLTQLDVPYDSSLIHEIYPTLSGAYESICALLKQGVVFPPALLACNDNIALGALKAFKEFGIRVPEDISLVGMDNISFSAISEPPLTSCDASCSEIGRWTVRLLDDKIRCPDTPTLSIQVAGRMHVRNSTCAYNDSRPKSVPKSKSGL